MKQLDAPGKPFRLEPNDHCEKYDGKMVEFIYDRDGKLMVLTGRFVTHLSAEFELVDIHYAGRLDPRDPPYVYYVFHISRGHLRSTAPAGRAGSRADFLMEKPLSVGDCVRGACEDWSVPAPAFELRGFE